MAYLVPPLIQTESNSGEHFILFGDSKTGVLVPRTDSGLAYTPSNNTVTTGIFKSNIATGTAPFIVTSTTVVANLNVDLLDGQHGSYYLNYNNMTNKPTIPTVGNGTLTMSTGTYLTGSATFTANQTGNTTFTVATNATSNNTVSTLVARDGSGSFSAGTISAVSIITTGDINMGGSNIGMGNDSSVIYFNDNNSETLAGYWSGKDGLSFRGDSNLEDSVVIRTGYAKINQAMHVGKKLGINNWSIEQDETSGSLKFIFG